MTDDQIDRLAQALAQAGCNIGEGIVYGCIAIAVGLILAGCAA